MAGAFVLALAAHLPFADEGALADAWAASYWPLLEALERLRGAGIRAPLALAVSPSVFAMLEDPEIRARLREELRRRERLCREHAGLSGEEAALAFQAGRLDRARAALEEGAAPLAARLRGLEEDGAVELLAATPGAALPLLAGSREVAAQLKLASTEHRHRFGAVPPGVWLAGCAYDGRVGPAAVSAGFEYVILEHVALERARPRPRCGAYAPVRAPGGLFALARDPEALRESDRLGAYARPEYAEPARDFGLEAGPRESRRPAGVFARRVSGDVSLSSKEPYDPAAASRAAREHAEAFAASLEERGRRLERELSTRPVLALALTAERFGVGWLEGPAFVEALLARLAASAATPPRTPSWVLAHAAEAEAAEPEASSWGPGSYFEAWLGDANTWLLPHAHGAAERMLELAERFGPKARTHPTPLQERALACCARLAFLIQAADWPELQRSREKALWARARFTEYVGAFLDLRGRLESGQLEEEALAAAERRCRLLPSADFRAWS